LLLIVDPNPTPHYHSRIRKHCFVTFYFLHFRFVLFSLFQAGFGFGSAAGFSNSFFPKGPAKNDPFAAFGAVSSFGFGFVSLFYYFISLFLFLFLFF
jgi:hypothetical protein